MTHRNVLNRAPFLKDEDILPTLNDKNLEIYLPLSAEEQVLIIHPSDS